MKIRFSRWLFAPPLLMRLFACDRVRDEAGSLKLSLRLAEANRLDGEAAAALICIALRSYQQGLLDEAEEHYAGAYGVAASIGDEALLASIEHNRGVLANVRGDVEGAIRCYGSSVERHQRLGDEHVVLLNQAHNIFGEMHARRELLDLERRLDSLEETYLRVVRAWGESIESKDCYTAVIASAWPATPACWRRRWASQAATSPGCGWKAISTTWGRSPYPLPMGHRPAGAQPP